jgi:hypothetical protein
MKYTITKTSNPRNQRISTKTKSIIVERKTITEEDIRKRAYEIYLENCDSQFDELDNWLNAERELREEDK